MNKLYTLQRLLAQLESDDVAAVRAAEKEILGAVQTAIRLRPESAIQFHTIAADVAELSQYEDWIEEDNKILGDGFVHHQERQWSLSA